MSKLTEKQKAFADYYIESLNATESYLRAYDTNNYKVASVEGSKNLEKPSIKSYIDERMNSKSNERIASQDEVLETLTSIMRGQLEEEVVSFTQLGEEVRTTKTPSIKDRMKASELLGKRYRLFTDKVEANVKSTTIIFEGEDELED